ncbi:MAG: hypothetical protein J0I49_30225 [Pseudonocardia sp.]|uniref:hypothetical protein n=1 Tax=Pseudonocardia sp. TaxID=60912 RepID=UPI001ACD3478|nr:hypothetical protein [Pseudonocardia sp.]MBN9102343.1 hypothetical protein [Pseudonocardia sp.]
MSETVGAESALKLQERRKSWYAHVARPIQFPEPSLTLDLDSRRESTVRMFRHVHQTCVFHRENFVAANEIKHLYLVDAFLALAKIENPIALYAVARSVFELNAFLYNVQSRLLNATRSVTADNWRQVGEKFFGILIRARFATQHPAYREMLFQEGVSSARLKPFNIQQCVTQLSSEPEHRDALDRYQLLCDYVHHNLGSATTVNSGSGTSDAARSAGGGAIIGQGPMTVTQYEYPVDGKLDRSLNELAPGFLRDALACVNWLNRTPASPFSPDLVEGVTGDPLGFDILREPRGWA